MCEWIRSHTKFAVILGMFLAPVALVVVRPQLDDAVNAPQYYPAPTRPEMASFASAHGVQIISEHAPLPDAP
jgi:hypothetical protein